MYVRDPMLECFQWLHFYDTLNEGIINIITNLTFRQITNLRGSSGISVIGTRIFYPAKLWRDGDDKSQRTISGYSDLAVCVVRFR
jgi:hypothetical protein